MQGGDKGIFTRKKRFFLISPNFQGAFSRKIGQKGGFFAVGGWLEDGGALGCKGLGLGRMYLKKMVLLWSARKNVVNLQGSCAVSMEANALIARK